MSTTTGSHKKARTTVLYCTKTAHAGCRVVSLRTTDKPGSGVRTYRFLCGFSSTPISSQERRSTRTKFEPLRSLSATSVYNHNPSSKRATMPMEAYAIKQAAASHVGVSLWVTPDRRQVVVVCLDDHGIFSRTGLKVGMKIDRINGVSCSGKTLKEVYRLLNEAVGWVSVVASAPCLCLKKAAEHSKMPSRLPEMIESDSSDSSLDENSESFPSERQGDERAPFIDGRSADRRSLRWRDCGPADFRLMGCM